MSYCSRKKWIAFSQDVQELRYALLAWFESLLGREATVYEGSDSFIYEPPTNWSKYKLVPYDAQSMPPLSHLDSGVLVCVDAGEHSRLAQAIAGNAVLLRIPWHPSPLPYKVGRERVYRVVAFPTDESWRERRPRLVDLAAFIRQIEGTQTVYGGRHSDSSNPTAFLRNVPTAAAIRQAGP